MLAWRVAAAGFLVVCLAVPAAAATRYQCTFDGDNKRGGNWVPSFLVVEDEGEKVIVYDPIIKQFVGQPIGARRSADTKGRVTYVWQVETRVKQQSTLMTYRLTYYRAGGRASMTVEPGGYDNSFSGDGTCKVSTR